MPEFSLSAPKRAVNCQLPEGDPDRKFKGRCVVQGSDVKDENSHAATFQELSSSPATLEAAKSVDAYGCIEGNDTQQCDAQQAYVQSELGGPETWISLPNILRPASWAEYYKTRVYPEVSSLWASRRWRLLGTSLRGAFDHRRFRACPRLAQYLLAPRA